MQEKNNTNLISIIVPVFKVESYLDNCVGSVLEQVYGNWELILVDDGSPDRCPEMCDNWAKKDSRIIVIHKKNGGLSDARNVGLEIARGEFVTFLDSDDFWHPEFLNSLLSACIDNNADMAQCGFVSGKDTTFPNTPLTYHYTVYDNHSVFLNRAVKVLMHGKLYKANLFDGIRMPVGLYNEDDWTAWKLYYRAKRIAVTSDRYYYYTRNPDGIMGQLRRKPDLRFLDAYKERIDFFVRRGEADLEHMSRWQVCKALVLYYSQTHSHQDRIKILELFRNQWSIIKESPYVPFKYKLIYRLFNCSPSSISWILTSMRTKHYSLFKRFT